MGDWLNKETALFQRDETGEIIPQSITLETLPEKPKVVLKVISRGVLNRIYQAASDGTTKEDQDDELIVNYCKKPEFTLEESKNMKPRIKGAIITALIAISTGTSQEEVNEQSQKMVIKAQEDILKKK